VRRAVLTGVSGGCIAGSSEAQRIHENSNCSRAVVPKCLSRSYDKLSAASGAARAVTWSTDMLGPSRDSDMSNVVAGPVFAVECLLHMVSICGLQGPWKKGKAGA